VTEPTFPPIAIVGRACVLPGALSPEDLWQVCIDGRDVLDAVAPDRWGIANRHVLGSPDDPRDRTWSDRGGYVTGFDDVFDPAGFALDEGLVRSLDPLFQWLLHTGRAALQDAGISDVSAAGAVIGNLSFPSSAMARYAENTWFADLLGGAPGREATPEDRFMSGLPAHLLAQGLGLGQPSYAIDAACASSLYAIKLACDALHDGRADVMLAGAVNRADDLFLHVGFCALKALSRTGRSRPLHRGADGLIPGSGAGIVVLKRLADAQRDGDRIHGVIRGVGLANDGRAGGLLAPAADGQERAVRAAYVMAGLTADDVSYIECHATGTAVGDAAEIESTGRVFAGRSDVPIGSLKSNMGHLITAAGVAGLLKVLGAFANKRLPPSLHADDTIAALDGSPFRVVREAEDWGSDGPRRAAVSAFGFGGNNAHLIVESYDESAASHIAKAAPSAALPTDDIAIVGLGAIVGDGTDITDVWQRISDDGAGYSGRADAVRVALKGVRFPPRDLQDTLAQQLLMLQAARDAVADGPDVSGDRAGIFVGMGCDPEVARYGARWRVPGWANDAGVVDEEWIRDAREAIVPVLGSAGVLGTMPNIPANRLNIQFDVGGPSLTVSSEELSGVRALQIAIRHLRAGQLDTAVVGAVDASVEPVHRAASEALGDTSDKGDAAVVFVLKRAADAQRDGDVIYALLRGDADGSPVVSADALTKRFGRAHAAWGLVQVLGNVLALSQEGGSRAVGLSLQGMAGQQATVGLVAPKRPTALHRPASAGADAGPVLTIPAHPAPINLPALPAPVPVAIAPLVPPAAGQVMQPAPALVPVVAPELRQVPTAPRAVASKPTPTPIAAGAPFHAPARASVAIAAAAPQANTVTPMTRTPVAPAPTPRTPSHTTGVAAVVARAAAHQAHVAELHRQFMATQGEVHRRFLHLRAAAGQLLLDARVHPPELALQPFPLPTGLAPQPQSAPAAKPAPAPEHRLKPPATSARDPLPEPAQATPAPAAAPAVFPGPKFSREDLLVHASGAISSIYGDAFKGQDGYERQVRMPEPPLLLADRVIGLDAEPATMGKGTIWTETDVVDGTWHMHDGRMPAGIMIESGQADLMLISWLGIDAINRGERVYRLLGCDLTYHGDLPRPGETLRYDIHCDGHASQGDIGLFFFHYDCRVGDEVRLSVREGQAGFFSDADLAASKGILWTPETGENTPDPRLDPALMRCTKTALSDGELQAWTEGDALACFGPGFERTATHTRTPTIAGGKMRLLERVTDIDRDGGPWGRGYLRAVDTITPGDWFFDGHFKNDPCMPGTLMFEGCLQAMAVYLTSLGYTTDNDAWRFAVAPDVTYPLRCRGQVLPSSKELIYEVFVDEFESGPYPTLWADILCTVDGLKAFHCRRLGLRLVPDWPLEDRTWVQQTRPALPWPKVIEAYKERKPVASIDGFDFGYRSLLACAWGKPSQAFGPMYEVFDDTRRVARLPGPPYHFMSRVTEINGDIGACTSGAVVELEYDVPADAWYFADNGAATMPFCVFLEAALQPCGWLASFVGSAVTTTQDLFFRNLDGTATWHKELLPDCGTLATRVKITNVSQSGGMIIESFDVECRLGDELVYDMKTVFGFFPAAALAAQKGLPISDVQRAHHDRPNEITNVSADYIDADGAVDLGRRDAPWFDADAKLPTPFLLMLDRIAVAIPDGGDAGLGLYRGEKDVDVSEWFFKAHFFQDPVQPGSLGIEAMIHLLQFAMLHQGMDEGIEGARFEPLQLGKPLSWKYRGQVRPHNKLIVSTLEITEKGRDDEGAYAIAKASLWVDGLRIYEASNLGMRLTGRPAGTLAAPSHDTASHDTASHDTATLTVVDPATDAWLADHRPTFTVPAVPLMVMADWIAEAAATDHRFAGRTVIGVRDVAVQRWLAVTEPTAIRAEVRLDPLAQDVARVRLFTDEGDFATGKVVFGYGFPTSPAADGSLKGDEQADPYASGDLFHGPALQVLKSLVFADTGASAILDASDDHLAGHALHPRLLDGATHAIPHDRLSLWSDAIADDVVAYPARIESLDVYGPAPTSGDVRCEVRFDGTLGPRLVAFTVQLIGESGVWCSFRLVEALFPKGPLGRADPQSRRAFLRDRRAVHAVGLSTTDDGITRLDPNDIAISSWLPGTITSLYGTEKPAEIAAKEHIGRLLHVHPGTVPAAAPLNRFPIDVSADDGSVVVRNSGPESLDLAPVRAFWSRWFGCGRWPVEDVYYALMQRFLRRVVFEDPAAFGAITGRSALYCANHQTGVESLLFSILASGLAGVPTVTLAKAEHRKTWLGRLIAHCFTWPGVKDPGIIAFFDRKDRSSLPRIIGELEAEMKGQATANGAAPGLGKSVMVHVEGTRSFSCQPPVAKMSSAFIDMALRANAPVVPVRFVGGLPVDPLDVRTEFPVGMGTQDIYIGRPILPETLADLPLKERKAVVIDGINRLGPANSDERPNPGETALDQAVTAWATKTGADPAYATLLQTLIRGGGWPGETLTEPIQRMVNAVETGTLQVSDSAEDAWLAELASRLFGPNGPRIAK